MPAWIDFAFGLTPLWMVLAIVAAFLVAIFLPGFTKSR